LAQSRWEGQSVAVKSLLDKECFPLPRAAVEGSHEVICAS